MSEPQFKVGDRCIIIANHPAFGAPADVGDIVILDSPYYFPEDRFNGWFLKGCGTGFYWREDWMAFVGKQERPKSGFAKFIQKVECKNG